MAVHNTDIVEMFEEMADLLELEEESVFRVQAYRQAAITIGELGRSVQKMLDDGEDLSELRGIGDDLAGKIQNIVKTGKFDELEDFRKQTVPTLREIMTVPQIGPKRAKLLHSELGIKDLDDLQQAVEDGRLREIRGFGKRAEEQITSAIETGRRKKERRLLSTVEEVAEALEEFLNSLDGVNEACVTGSYRRKAETVGDLDSVASSNSSGKVVEQFVEFEEIEQVLNKGKASSSVVLRSGLQVDLRVVKPESYGAALIYFTGAKDHQLTMRDMAINKDQKLNEYGLFDKNDKKLAGKTEADVYKAFKLAYVEPEMRENRGEIDLAAKKDGLPKLISIDDIRGDLHCHSTWSDGRGSIEEMAKRAKELGYDYLAITDHSKRMRMVNGLSGKDLQKQAEEIKKVDESIKGLTLLAGCEVDILEDGKLDLSDDVLVELDIVICSIHSKMDLSNKKQTDRLLKAIENPNCQMLGHLQGRKILEREAIDIDLERVLTEARDAGVIVEINADPVRRDLDENGVHLARELGLKFAVNTDAHSVAGLDQIKYGIWTARRGWLEKKHVINTGTLNSVKKALRSG
jgi:DNA polymerase (family X)